MSARCSAAGTFGLAGVVVLGLVASALAERPKYRVQRIEPYPGHRITWSQPQTINSRNVTAGDSVGPSEMRATRWHPDGSMVGLDYSSFPRAKVHDINENNIVGGYAYWDYGRWEAAIWAEDGSVTVLGGLWEQFPGLSEVKGINDAGVAVGASSSDTSLARPFVWTAESGMVDLGTLGGSQGAATAIDNAGLIIGIAFTADNKERAVIWEDGEISPLGVLPGGTLAEALDINEQGLIVGCADIGPTTDEDPLLRLHPVRWDVSTAADAPPAAVDLGVPFAGGQAYAVAINNLGQIVGNGEDPAQPGDYYFPWIWEGGVMTLLQDLIPPDSPWILYQVTDINDNGWITGSDAYGEAQGLVLIPLAEADIDMDGDVDADDVAAFIGVLVDPDVAPAGLRARSDFNDDLSANGIDIPLFVSELLSTD